MGPASRELGAEGSEHGLRRRSSSTDALASALTWNRGCGGNGLFEGGGATLQKAWERASSHEHLCSGSRTRSRFIRPCKSSDTCTQTDKPHSRTSCGQMKTREHCITRDIAVRHIADSRRGANTEEKRQVGRKDNKSDLGGEGGLPLNKTKRRGLAEGVNHECACATSSSGGQTWHLFRII